MTRDPDFKRRAGLSATAGLSCYLWSRSKWGEYEHMYCTIVVINYASAQHTVEEARCFCAVCSSTHAAQTSLTQYLDNLFTPNLQKRCYTFFALVVYYQWQGLNTPVTQPVERLWHFIAQMMLLGGCYIGKVEKCI